MKLKLLLLYLLMFSYRSTAQNLIPDPGFEILRGCPKLYEFDSLVYWKQASSKGKDPSNSTNFGLLYHKCSGNVPQTGWGWFDTHSGDGMGSVVANFIATPLKQPIKKGKTYRVSFWLQVGTKQNIGCWWQTYNQKVSLFGFKQQPLDTVWGPVRQPPLHIWSITERFDTTWVKFEACFKPDDDYSWVGFGYKDTYLNLDCDVKLNEYRPPFLTTTNQYAFRQLPFFIDDIELEDATDETLPSIQLASDLCQNTDVILDGSKIFPKEKNNNNIAYKWWNGADSARVTVNKRGKYHLTVQKTCKKVEVDFEVKNKNCYCRIFMPTSFSPNDDGVNDTFKPFIGCDDAEIIEQKLTIYNRWGSPIFQTTDLKGAWDGTVKNVAAQNDTFVWLLTYALRVGKNIESFTEAGEVTLTR
jgi:gliding motility-associated-like protein